MTTNKDGYYLYPKTTPGSGVVLGTYSATVARRAYLGATKATNCGGRARFQHDQHVGDRAAVVGRRCRYPAASTVPLGITIADLSAIAGVFGSSVSPDTGNDVNGDGFVNIFDLVLAGGNLDKTSSPW